MAKGPEPVVLDLATLARDQMGPFLILGLDKAADKEQMESHWADRVKWARKGLLKVPLEDVNWARDILNDKDRRVGADAGSLNADTAEGVLGQLARRYGLRGGQATRMWQPLDVEKPLADYAPPAEVPAPEAVRAALSVPAVPEDYPAVPSLLESLVQQTPGPWALELPTQDQVS
ncbi:MAG TPA: hypothetical protein VFE78_22715 [Gemmataceae bacterium]|jgi:hypothetical protein|nr:hypothetical protein [Gemmataceae bacterium]